jgi:hypothetical protein
MSAVVPQPVSLVRAVLHLCVVDLRRFRWLAAGVVGVEVVRGLVVEGSLHLAQPTTMDLAQASADAALSLFDLAIPLLAILATAVLVQADHPTDDRAFWRTRPIAPVAVAGAKLATMALLFVGIPSAINVVRLAAYGAPAVAMTTATLQIAVLAGMVCVPAWFVAVATRTLPRFLGTVLGTLVIGYFTLSLSLMLFSPSTPRGGPGIVPFVDWQHLGTHGWWGGAISTLAGLAILIAHYAVRRMKATVAGLLLLMLIPRLVPPGSPLEAPADLAGRVAGRLALPEGLAALSASGASYREPTIHVTGPIALPGLPADVSAGVRLERITVRASGSVVPAVPREQCCAGKGSIGALSAAAAAKADPHQRQLIGSTSLEVFSVSASAVDGLRRGALDLDADATVSFTRHRLVGTLPIQPGASLRTDRYLLEVLGLETFTGRPVAGVSNARMHVLVRFTRFPSLAGAGPRVDLFRSNRARDIAEPVRAPWPIATYNPDTTVENWAYGRRWVGRFWIVIEPRSPATGLTDLVVVEAAFLGTTRTAFTATGVPIRLAPMY